MNLLDISAWNTKWSTCDQHPKKSNWKVVSIENSSEATCLKSLLSVDSVNHVDAKLSPSDRSGTNPACACACSPALRANRLAAGLAEAKMVHKKLFIVDGLWLIWTQIQSSLVVCDANYEYYDLLKLTAIWIIKFICLFLHLWFSGKAQQWDA